MGGWCETGRTLGDPQRGWTVGCQPVIKTLRSQRGKTKYPLAGKYILKRGGSPLWETLETEKVFPHEGGILP